MAYDSTLRSRDLHDFLDRMALKYQERAPRLTDDATYAQVMAHVMSIGTYTDIQELRELTPPAELRAVLDTASSDRISRRAQRYWSRRLASEPGRQWAAG